MSPIAAGLDGLLALLLLLALGLGFRLNTRLKTLREGQAGFAAAVIELNQAAARAEAGLAALRAASESAHDDLLARIETARALVVRLERAGADAHRTLDALPERPAAGGLTGAAGGGSLAAIAALAEGRLIERGAAAPDPRPAAPSTPRRSARPALDEELFETKSRDPGPRERVPRAGAPQAGAPQAGALQAGAPQAGAPQAGAPQEGGARGGLLRDRGARDRVDLGPLRPPGGDR